jgi:nitrile hydratase subunit beta
MDKEQPRAMQNQQPRAMQNQQPRAMHDLGGVSKFMCEPVDTEPHALTDFDREVDALRVVLGAKQIMTVDEIRRAIESIPESDYLRLSYYRKWIRAIADHLLRKGIITEDELCAELERS